MYPLGPFPQDILRMMAASSPQTYGRLAPVSKRVRAAIGPVLPVHCDSPPNVREIITQLRGISGNYNLVFSVERIGQPVNHLLNSIIFFKVTSPRRNEIYHYLEIESDYEDLPPFLRHLYGARITLSGGSLNSLLKDLARHGYNLLSLNLLFDIYQGRTSCANLDPHYALRKVWEIFQNRLQRLVSLAHENINKINIEGTNLETLGTFVEEFLEILDDEGLFEAWEEYMNESPYPLDDPSRIDYIYNFLPQIKLAVDERLAS